MDTAKIFWSRMIHEALAMGAEYNFLDFKLDLSEKNDRVKEHINAFGNYEAIGGTFVFGIQQFSNKSKDCNADEIIKRITHLAKDTQEPSLNVDAFPVDVDGKQLLCVHILPAKSRPVFIKDRIPWGGNACFKRTGSSTVAMSNQEIKDLLAISQDTYDDESGVNQINHMDLDFEKLHLLLPKLDKNDILSANNIAILTDNRVLTGIKNAQQVTLAGWLCFANNPQVIRQFRNAYIEFQIFKGTARNMPIKKYEVMGNLPNQIEQAIGLLQQHIWTIPHFKGTKREEVPAYSELVLREVITNSLVHRDYRKMHQPVKIAMFDNRIEIENPGNLLPGLTTFNLVHRREWRNPLLANIMKKFGFGEMDGQGIDRLYAAAINIKIPPPRFEERESSFTVILQAPKSYKEFSVEDKRLMIIILCIMHDTIENEHVRNCFDISSEKAGTLLKAMVADKILKSHGPSRKYAKYSFTQEYKEKVTG